MKKRLKTSVKIVIGIIVCLAVAGGVVGGVWVWGEYKYRYDVAVVKSGNLKVYPNEGLEDVAYKLQNENIINNAALLLKFAASHEKTNVRVGNYELSVGTTYRSLLNTLTLGKQTPIKLTFNSFRTTERLLGAVARRVLADSVQLVDFFEKQSDFSKDNLISLFIPNTYEVYWTITPQEFYERMEQEYNRFWSRERLDKAQRLGFTPVQIATIASIVDSETNKVDEMSNVAGVYINRIRKRMPLQADPTVKFALGDFSIKRVLLKHLEVDSPYNTYKYQGLPPGAICMASIAAIDATLNYAGHDYYYFCAREDFSGYHSFARTLGEHNANAKRYQAELNRLKIK